VILVNIFAGINRCDWIAEGIVRATKDLDVQVPIVVRLAGTRVDEGREILNDSGLSLIIAEDLDQAASKAVDAIVVEAQGYRESRIGAGRRGPPA
jgi:succinyl-CoA synthetase beta subunit